MAKLWIFDLDGTLTDSFPVFTESMTRILRDHGMSFDDNHLREILGSDPVMFFARHLGPERAEECARRLLDLSIELAGRVKPYEGIVECLDRIESEGREISVWTGRDLRSAREVLKTTGLDKYVRHCVSGTCVARNKPDPEGALRVLAKHGKEAGDAVMIGDHVHDMTAAKAIGLFGIRASWNGYWGSAACELADRQFHSVADFTAWVDRTLRPH